MQINVDREIQDMMHSIVQAYILIHGERMSEQLQHAGVQRKDVQAMLTTWRMEVEESRAKKFVDKLLKKAKARASSRKRMDDPLG